MPECSEELREQNLAYPRTCGICKLGPCHKRPLPADMRPIELWVENDAELAKAIKNHIAELNKMVDEAAKRELVVAYRIKDGQKTDALTNPRIIVSVMTEVT